MTDTKVIRTFANEVEAYVAQAVLDANGIDSHLIRDDAGGMMPWLQWLHPIRLVVLEADSAAAIEILDSPPGSAESAVPPNP
ncbi:MAG: DUF2007 domain-containing protein [Gemmatimonadota bacterium]|nr:DUF2007 domain-containing protein [Gemmatimonadota bacterium]